MLAAAERYLGNVGVRRGAVRHREVGAGARVAQQRPRRGPALERERTGLTGRVDGIGGATTS